MLAFTVWLTASEALDTAFRAIDNGNRSEEWRAATGINGGTLRISAMSYIAVTFSAARMRIRRAEAWLESRNPDEELLIIGASLDAANELVRRVAKKKGAAFGWHRLTLAQLAFAIAAPILAARGLTPLTRIGADALVARLVHRMSAEDRLRRLQVPARPNCRGLFDSLRYGTFARTRCDANERLRRNTERYLHCAVNPPSIAKTAPVTKLDSSLARKSTPAATSSGVPIRPIGVSASVPAVLSGSRARTISVPMSPG